MLKKRLIFTLLFEDNKFILSRNFRRQKVGDINWLHKNYNFSNLSFNIDELILEDGLWKYGGNTLPARNGHIDLHIEGTVTGLIDGDANLTVLQDVNAIVKGTTTLDCPTTHITGDVRIDGDLSVGKDVKCENGDAGSKVSLYSHNHPGDGGGGLAAHAASTSSPNADD